MARTCRRLSRVVPPPGTGLPLGRDLDDGEPNVLDLLDAWRLIEKGIREVPAVNAG